MKNKRITALVVEGGGMRGIFAAGILDAFLANGFNPFDMYFGVSAGACNLSSHLAGQHERNYRIYTNIMTRPEFINTFRFIRGGHLMDLDFLWESIAAEDPLDVSAVVSHGNRFIITATSVEGGSPSYLVPDTDTCLDCLKASSALPLVYRDFPVAGGVAYVDGGVNDPIPAAEAYRRGVRRIVVIRSRQYNYYKSNRHEAQVMSWLLRKYRYLSSAIQNQIKNYARCIDFILNPPEDCEMVVIAPPEPLKSGRTTRDREALDIDYQLGIALGTRAMEKWGKIPALKNPSGVIRI